MARVVAFVPDLLFGSQVQGALRAAGHDVRLATDEPAVRVAFDDADVLIVDLTDDAGRRTALVESLIEAGALKEDALPRVRTLAFYSHVEADTRALAKKAGFDLVVPRSRMARECGALVARLVDSA